uniref:Uncharacterized protein n=1 Tax=Glossina palpalis gambiensis TaxID=67801 RepID=A0A1B0C2K9_9MUSC
MGKYANASRINNLFIEIIFAKCKNLNSSFKLYVSAINYIYAHLFLKLTSHHTETKQPRYCNDKQNMFLILYFINPNYVEWNTALGDFKLSHVTWRISGSSEYVVLSRHLVELTLS